MTTFGCAGDFPLADADSEVARRLRAAGAIIVGKTTTPEFGQWPITESTAFGVTRNPWNLDHTPGRLVRRSRRCGRGGPGRRRRSAPTAPARCAFRRRGPTSSASSPSAGGSRPGPTSHAFNGLTCFGPLARTVADAAALLDVAAGNHPEDSTRPPPPTAPYSEAAGRDPGQLRIGLSLRAPFSGAPWKLAPEVRREIERIAGRAGDPRP